MSTDTKTKNMDFCPNCSNMLWPKEIENEKGRSLLNYCRVCSYSEPCNRIMISSHVFSKNTSQSKLATSIYHKTDCVFDFTLRRTKKIPCPNKNCPSTKDISLREIILKNDPINLHVTYICSQCRKEWKST